MKISVFAAAVAALAMTVGCVTGAKAADKDAGHHTMMRHTMMHSGSTMHQGHKMRSAMRKMMRRDRKMDRAMMRHDRKMDRNMMRHDRKMDRKMMRHDGMMMHHGMKMHGMMMNHSMKMHGTMKKM